jgi:hypothetical protein
MRLMSIFTSALSGVLARIQRDAISYGLCAICGIAAIILVTSASILALEPSVGVVYARLIVAGVYVLIAGVTLLRMRRGRSAPSGVATPLGARGDSAQRGVQFAQIAMIVEAVMLGYSLSRRSDRR